jgi:hypothetical protein
MSLNMAKTQRRKTLRRSFSDFTSENKAFYGVEKETKKKLESVARRKANTAQHIVVRCFGFRPFAFSSATNNIFM